MIKLSILEVFQKEGVFCEVSMIDHFVHKLTEQGGGLYIEIWILCSVLHWSVSCMGELVLIIQQAKVSLKFGS